jgi:SpoVK/Ycf46/Vps4 family AAA+-type ATPase
MHVEPVIVPLTVPDAASRAQLWRASVVGPRLAPDEAALIAARFPFTPGTIARAAARAAEEPWSEEGLARVCRDVASVSFDGFARRLPNVYRREDLVLSDDLEQEFSLLLSWIRHRQQVLGRWNLGRRLANCWGLTVLLAGAPGTGKTMAAQVLGHELQTDVYRVDLSQVVSKYIGETEKHLNLVLTAAQQAGAVLLFDEADTLFGRRSEVRDARDRYANLEIGFLLQRIEEHEGIVLLSTNRTGDMDQAFQRRFQFVLSFPLPDRELRARIWRTLLPRDACEDGIELAGLAERFHLTGGEIRNAVVAAAFLAAADSAKISQAHLLAALRREVLKTGRVLRSEEREDPSGEVDPRGRRMPRSSRSSTS